jgi:hypothetical protein
MAALCELTLPTLPSCELFLILRLLPVRELCLAACSCKALLQAAGDEALWLALCDTHPGFKEAHGFTAVRARAALSVGSYRSLYQVLASLGGSPLGLWRCVDERLPPKGVLLACLLRPSSMMLLSPHAALNPVLHGGDDMLYSLASLVALAHLGSDNHALRLRWRHVGTDKSCSSKCLRVQKDTMVVEVADVLALSDLAGWMAFHPVLRDVRFQRLEGPLFPALLPPGTSPTPHALQGIFTAPYGSHGNEYIQLRLALEHEAVSGGQTLPAKLAPASARLEALKLTGDENVPAGRLTFVCDVASACEPNSPLCSALWNATRPVYSFESTLVNGAPVQLNMDARRGATVTVFCRCYGQINVDTAVWAPQWVAATLLVYRAGQVSAAARHLQAPVTFSVVWTDEGLPYRHAMDFVPLCAAAFDRLGSCEWNTPPTSDHCMQ